PVDFERAALSQEVERRIQSDPPLEEGCGFYDNVVVCQDPLALCKGVTEGCDCVGMVGILVVRHRDDDGRVEKDHQDRSDPSASASSWRSERGSRSGRSLLPEAMKVKSSIRSVWLDLFCTNCSRTRRRNTSETEAPV